LFDRARILASGPLIPRAGRPTCSSVACRKLFYSVWARQWSMSFAPALVLREGERKNLGDLARLPSVPSGLAKRARMILLAADGLPNAEIARLTGVSRPTVIGGVAPPGRELGCPLDDQAPGGVGGTDLFGLAIHPVQAESIRDHGLPPPRPHEGPAGRGQGSIPGWRPGLALCGRGGPSAGN
jgi:hypothetical protein